jgi:hypothetical protein
MNRVYAPIVRATSLSEAVFIPYMLHLWLAKRDDDDRYIYRKDDRGFWINPQRFCRKTGLSAHTFRNLVKKYKDLGILKTTVDKADGNKKYYKLRTKKLRWYLKGQMANVTDGSIERGPFEEIDVVE